VANVPLLNFYPQSSYLRHCSKIWGNNGVAGSKPWQTLLFVGCHWVCLRWVGWTQEHKRHREDATAYPDSGHQGPTSSSRWSLHSRAPKIGGGGLQQSVREIWQGSSVLILSSLAVRSPPHRRGIRRWKRREGALGTPLRVALLSV
jgi:hypothetical protein